MSDPSKPGQEEESAGREEGEEQKRRAGGAATAEGAALGVSVTEAMRAESAETESTRTEPTLPEPTDAESSLGTAGAQVRGGQKRLLSLDMLRGIAIVCVVFLHNSAFHYAQLHELLKMKPPPLPIMILGFLIMWAGLFGVISGFANAFTMVRRLEKKGHLTTGEVPPGFLKTALVSFLIIFAMHWLWTLVTGNSVVLEDPNNPELRVSLLIGLIYYGEFKAIHPQVYFFASALWMIAANVLFVSIVLAAIARRRGFARPFYPYKVLLVLALIVLFVTPVVRAFLFGPMMSWIKAGGLWWLAALPVALLINDPNPMLPYLAFGLVGAVLGVAMARGEEKSLVYRFLWIFGALWVVIGGGGLSYAGGLIVAGRNEVWGQSALYAASLAYLLLGTFCFVLFLLLAYFDYCSPEKQRDRAAFFRPLRRFGQLSLTVFILEGIVAMLWRLLLDTVAPPWNHSLAYTFAFALANVLFWHVALKLWERVNYAGSLEWFIGLLKKR